MLTLKSEDDYFLTLCHYVEANPLRAGLVERAEQWRWSGLWKRTHRGDDLNLCPRPVERPRKWTARVNQDFKKEQIEDIRMHVQRGRPFGSESWVRKTADRLKQAFTLRGPSRPRKAKLI